MLGEHSADRLDTPAQPTGLTVVGGVLYGTTSAGGVPQAFGIPGGGVLFKINPDGTAFQTLRAFSGADGFSPRRAMVASPSGMLYGTNTDGGALGGGTLYRFVPAP